MSYAEAAWIVDAVFAVVLHRYKHVNFFFITYTFIYTTSLGCLLSSYFIFIYGLGGDFTWGDWILGDQQHI